MALSQLRCLDENHVNPRTSESKPEFLYCEDQRLALEALLRDGREAFFKYLESRGLRGFLSDPEQETLCASAEPYEPDSELLPEQPEESGPPLSLHYWPNLSDTSIPEMDLGWPDSAAYRGVTRAAVYCQPPIDGQAHIKEVVRRMIAQAQKLIAVAMDVFTDVDIFRDLLEVSFKKRVSVYILLDRTALPHFLAMCQRANMHTGHLKHLRIRCSGGSEFYTRSSTRVRGRLEHRFMFIDGDKAVSGSYSFTWMSSRLDRNLITVVTGQAVETFDKLFRILYANSSSVDLQQVAMETEPEPEKEPLPQPATVVPPSAAIAMKLYNPKYNLVFSPSAISSPPLLTRTTAADQDNSQKSTSEEISKNPVDHKKKRCKRASKESLKEPPPLHPSLSSLEKVCLISFLPTWPEPDPPIDVIGFINIRDTSKPLQAHLQRSEMFESSLVIRFSSPISIPKEDLPLVAKPRNLIAEQGEMKKLSQGQTPAEEPPGDLKRKLENKTLASEMQHKSARNAEYELNMTIQDSGHNTTDATPDNSDKTNPSSNCEVQRFNNPKDSSVLPGSNTKTCDSNVIINGFNRTQASPQTGGPTDSSTSQWVHPIEMTPDLQTSSSSSPIHAHLSSTSSPLITPPPNLALPPSSESSCPPTPKPRTVQLVIKDTVHNNGQKLQEVSIVRRQQSNAGLQEHDQPASVGDSWSLKDSVRLQNSIETAREGKVGDNVEIPMQENVHGNYRETKIEEVEHDVKATPESKHLVMSGDIMAGVTERLGDLEKVHEDDESDCIATAQSENTRRGPTGFQSDEVTHENRKNVVKQKAKLSGGHALRKIWQTTLTDGISSVFKTSSHMPVSDTHNPNTLVEDCTSANGGALNGVNSSKELSPKSHASSSSSEISLSSNMSKTQKKDLCLRIPDRELRPLSPLGHTPSTPSPDPRLHTPDSRSRTPDFRTPTSDFNDGFGSPRTLSTTSDEYYECSDLPCYDTSDHVDFSSCSMREHDFRASHANTANKTDVTTTEENTSDSRVDDHKAIQAEDKKNTHWEMKSRGELRAQRRGGEKAKSTIDTFIHSNTLTEVASQETDRKRKSKAERLDERRGVTRKRTDSETTSIGGTQKEKMTARTEPASISSSSSSLLDPKVIKSKDKKKEREWPGLEMKGREGKKAQRRGGEEIKSTPDTFKQSKTLTEVASEETNRIIPTNVERLDEGGVTRKTMESAPSSTGDPQKEKKRARDGRRETEEEKMSHTPPQQDRGTGPASPQTIQAKNGTLPNAAPVPGNTEAPPRSPKPPSPPTGEGRRQRTKARQWRNKISIPKSLNAHVQAEQFEQHPDSQKPPFQAEDTQRQVDRKFPFNLTFSHLYSSKHKTSKRPAQSKRGNSADTQEQQQLVGYRQPLTPRRGKSDHGAEPS